MPTIKYYDTNTSQWVTVTGTGPAGPAGAAGPTGPEGPPGPSGGSYMHTQNTPASVWTIDHNLGYQPNVTVVDSGGSAVEGSVTYVDGNTITVEFTASFSGVAYLS